MKRLVLIFGLTVLWLAACNKEKVNYTGSGEIVAWDRALCPCCGGAILQIDNTTGNFRIESLPGMEQQDFQNLVFPKRIRFNQDKGSTCAGIEYVKITSYQFE